MVNTPLILGLLVVGSITGVLSGLLGIGGGLVMVPVLTMLGIPLVQATATSLVAVFLSAVSGSIRNLQAGELNWRVSLTLALFGIVTAQLGAWLGDRAPDGLLSLAFAGLLLITIYLMALKKSLVQKQARAQLVDAANIEAEIASKVAFENTPTAAAETLPPSPPLSQPVFALLPVAQIGLLAGLLSGLFGVGGGVVMVPLQMLMLGERIKSAVRTSLGAIVAIAISALAQHAWNGNVLWIPGIALGLGGVVGAQLGTRILPKLPDSSVNTLFRGFLIVLSIYMVLRGIRLLG
ncbi:MAG: sulfite exporter TauE/SafE family protein [Kaiparowitsia implicata GSE-PSE-MK54-09C]|jgi:uncharacterized membrane protein YfcA|nr:sulfite exporter TauE/SafE family protein [Kaiparowitsia implicata GSE-PSE-MK54-09C]